MIHSAAGNRRRVLQLHGLRIAEVQPVTPLRHDNRVLALRSLIPVVRILNLYRLAFSSSGWIDAREAVAKVVEHPQLLEVVGWNHMLWLAAHRKMADDLEGFRVDDVHAIAAAARNVDQRWKAAHRRSKPAGPVRGVDVEGVQHPPHARQ